jgi:hypothetical protein
MLIKVVIMMTQMRTSWNSSVKELGPSMDGGNAVPLIPLWLQLGEINFPLRGTQLCFCCFHQSQKDLH